MLGAKDFVGSENSLTFRIGRNAKSVSHLVITLMPSDTYEVKALRVRRQQGVPTVKTLGVVDDVYVDSLHQVIESLTGMATSIPRIVQVVR
jgi:hypothetical protein